MILIFGEELHNLHLEQVLRERSCDVCIILAVHLHTEMLFLLVGQILYRLHLQAFNAHDDIHATSHGVLQLSDQSNKPSAPPLTKNGGTHYHPQQQHQL